MATKTLKAPGHLRPETARWWMSVVESYELEAHHIHVLTLAAETLDRIEQARRVIAKEGLTVPTQAGSKLHPAVRVEQEGKTIFARLLRELDLDVDPPAEARRPPMLRSVGVPRAS